MRIDRFEKNANGRDFVVGDIHGCFRRLETALQLIGFDTEKDRLFSVGDLVDRGPNSNDVLDWLANRPWFHPVMGNHDDMAIRWPYGNMQRGNYEANGGGWNINNPSDTQIEISGRLQALPLGIEVETANGLVGIVHAEVPFDDWEKFRTSLDGSHYSRSSLKSVDATAMWSRNRIGALDRSHVAGVHAVVCGHTPVKERLILGNVHYIDTGAVFGNKFTILDLETLEPV